MNKTIQKIKNLFWLIVLSMVVTIGIIPIAIFVPIIWLRIVLILLLSGLNLFVILYIVKKQKALEKLLEKEIKELEDKRKKKTLLDLYGILGISPQYKSDGTLKDIYDLLGIEPQYDENGKRVLTIYELLQINPRFTADGIEIPLVFRIKNRINALVKASASIPLFYVPRGLVMAGIHPLIGQPLPPDYEGKPVDKTAKTPPIVIKHGSSTKNKGAAKIDKPNYPKATSIPKKKNDKKKDKKAGSPKKSGTGGGKKKKNPDPNFDPNIYNPPISADDTSTPRIRRHKPTTKINTSESSPDRDTITILDGAKIGGGEPTSSLDIIIDSAIGPEIINRATPTVGPEFVERAEPTTGPGIIGKKKIIIPTKNVPDNGAHIDSHTLGGPTLD